MPDDPPDPEHTARIQALFIEHQPLVKTMALSIVRDIDVAGDVVQEVFLTATKKAGQFKLGTNFPAWITTITKYKAREALRRPSTRFVPLQEETIEALWDSAPPMEDFERRVRHFECCMDELAPQAKRIFRMRYLDSHLPAFIAHQLGQTVGSVKVTLSRARGVLKDCVQRKLADELAS